MRRLRGLVLLFTVLTLFAGSVTAQGVNARNLLKLARSAAESKDWAKARDYANQALQDEGGYLDAYYMRAFAHRQLGEKKKAEEDFREVIRRDPHYLPTYGALADMFMADQEWDKAEKVFTELGQQNDGAKWASYYRGVMAYMRGDLKTAESQWKDCLAKDVNFAQAIHNLGAIALARQEHPRALSLFREALEKKPNSAMYRFHVAWAMEQVGQSAKALEGLKAIMNENADDQRFWLLARALDQILRGQNETALKVLETVTKDYPSSLDGWFLKGRAALAVGNHALAREALEKAKELDPHFAATDGLLAKLPPKPASESSPPESATPPPELKTPSTVSPQSPDPHPLPPVREKSPSNS